MSLTNPNTVVTEERLNDFYKGILPYLGGMPEMLANKFSKGDLYSTDEKMIGQWINGKPLYQKTIQIGDIAVVGSVTYKNLGVTNADTLISSKLWYTFSDGNKFDSEFLIAYNYGYACPYIDHASHKIYMAYKTSIALFDMFAIIQYTKTTDSAISIGDANDYSTEEKIIGTWVDGKPIYQRTFVKSSGFSTDFYLADLSDSNIDTIIKGEGWWTRLAGGVITQYPFGRTETPSYANYDVNIRYVEDVKKLRVFITGYPAKELANMRYTIQYTKTN